MRYVLSLFLLVVAVCHADKAAIQACMESGDRLGLACAYFSDQNEVAAYRCYLDLLADLDGSNGAIGSEEAPYYQAALDSYLTAKDWREASVTLFKDYAPIADEHPDYHALGLLVAIAEANLGQTLDFLQRFAVHAPAHPQHFLVDKVRAILSVKIQQKGRSPAEREPWRKQALVHLKSGMQLCPQDSSLLNLAFVLSKDDDLVDLLQHCQQLGIAVPRKEIHRSVEAALAADAAALAKDIVARARDTYKYSRTLARAEKLIKEREGES